MTGLPPAAVRQLSTAEVAVYAEWAEAADTAARLAQSRARVRRG
jgi:hypothetical protein